MLNLHGHRLFEFPFLLDAKHQIAAVDIFHHKIQSILHAHTYTTTVMAIFQLQVGYMVAPKGLTRKTLKLTAVVFLQIGCPCWCPTDTVRALTRQRFVLSFTEIPPLSTVILCDTKQVLTDKQTDNVRTDRLTTGKHDASCYLLLMLGAKNQSLYLVHW